MNKVIPIVILTAYVLLIIVFLSSIVKADELNFQIYENGEYRTGTIRQWGQDSYKIQSHGVSGPRERIIYIPNPNPYYPDTTPQMPLYPPEILLWDE